MGQPNAGIWVRYEPAPTTMPSCDSARRTRAKFSRIDGLKIKSRVGFPGMTTTCVTELAMTAE